jgi:O-antigen ligase
MLCLLFLFLPYSEFLKHLFFSLYTIFWLTTRYRLSNFGGRIDHIDLLMLSIPALGLISTTFSEFSSLKMLDRNFDMFRIMLFGLMVRRTLWSKRDIYTLLTAVTVGALIALFHGWFIYFYQGVGDYPILKSVGHVNHSAIYLLLVGLWLLSAFLLASKKVPHLLTGTLSVLFFCALIPTVSRAAVGAYLIIGILLVVLAITVKAPWAKTKGLSLAITGVIVLLGFAGALLNEQRSHSMNPAGFFEDRVAIWRAALVVVPDKPFLGAGPGAYKSVVTESNVARLNQDAPKPLPSYSYFDHGHNLAITWLVERGAIGLILLIGFFMSVTKVIVSSFIQKTNLEEAGIALVSLSVVLVVGIANTTFHHEHGLLSMLMTCLLLAKHTACQQKVSSKANNLEGR